MHPFQHLRESKMAPQRAKDRLRGYASGGAVKTDPGVDPTPRGSVETPASRADTDGCAPIKRASGGKVAGGKMPMRLDKFARGGAPKGKKSKGNHVNIVIGAPPGGDKEPMPIPVPVPGGPGPAPMAPPPGPMAGGPPMMPPKPPMGGMPMPMRAKGGKVDMDDGAGSGPGRVEKAKIYGKRALPGGKAGTM